MTHSAHRAWVMMVGSASAIACIFAALTSCGGTESCWGLEVGQTYTFTVREVRPDVPPAPGSPCAPSLPPMLGDAYQFRVTGEQSAGPARDCFAAYGELEGQHSLKVVEGQVYPPLGDKPYSSGSGQVMRAGVFIDWNGCRGTWSIEAVGRSSDHNPFAAYRPGKPVVTLYRSFMPEAFATPENIPAGCGRCVDHFGVEVSK